MEELIKKNKPKISASSIKTYCSLLRTLYAKDHSADDKEMDLDWFNRQEHIIELMKDKPPSNRKTVYAALIAVAKDSDLYKKALMDDGKTYDKFIKTQTKTEKQSENWKSFDEVKGVYDSILKKVKPLLSAKDSPLSPEDFRKVQDLVILALTSGIFISPRRSTDWTEMKVAGPIDKANDNYIEKGFFVFNKYKTAKYYDTQRVEIPKALKSLLTKYLKLNQSDYLLSDNKGNKLTNVRLSQKLNKIFDSAISTSMLRHIYLTEQLKNVPALEKLEKMAHDLGNSPMQMFGYVKK